MKQAQLTSEFVIFCSIAFIFLISFLYLIQEQMSLAANEKEQQLLVDLASSIQKEIETAAQVQDGYARTFSLPQTLSGIPYSTEITLNRLTVFTDKNSYEVSVQALKNGSYLNTTNTIRREQAIVCINIAC